MELRYDHIHHEDHPVVDLHRLLLLFFRNLLRWIAVGTPITASSTHCHAEHCHADARQEDHNLLHLPHLRFNVQ